ncbi:hypothetical protein [Pelagicoccus albus]|uniref:SGNH hydrolase-type esterase domain-containing protein n=1 Tax=Pelagicoccus albus TaxID=415222 RepID=A0A7X1B730_9BACT|nr:hypothetical protein [Pelagicoccus albus]MBC2605578.1 hypothetical protein [Pelagicoccus albus]
MEHPTIEYMAKPNQDLTRLGNRILVNQYGMRSEPFSPKGSGEYRVMVFGDSVIHGDSQTDHETLATSILQKRISDESEREVIVGNISAGSWGPGNWRAYAEEYGFFDANVVIMIASSHDYIDTPNFAPIDTSKYPTEKPGSAIGEIITRYLPRYLPALKSSPTGPNNNRVKNFTRQDHERACRDDLKAFLQLALTATPQVIVFQHWQLDEVERGVADEGNTKIGLICQELSILPIQLGPYFAKAIESGEKPYLDLIHPSERGHELIAEAILEHLP